VNAYSCKAPSAESVYNAGAASPSRTLVRRVSVDAKKMATSALRWPVRVGGTNPACCAH
jgi:hypothetical protein